MKKVKKTLVTLLSPLFVLLLCMTSQGQSSSKVTDLAGEDTAIYQEDNDKVAKLNEPDITNKHLNAASEDEEDEEDVAVSVDKVILHYYNEAGGNDGRAFYLWVTGVDGTEYSLDNATDIFKVNEDKTMMTINIDFSDSRFSSFANKSKLYFIIKYKKISATNLNWGGQSDDMQLVYSEYKDNITTIDGKAVCEVWTMPAAGGGIAILTSEEETKVPGIQLAQFTDWKTITCQFTSESKSANYSLYAFDETYYKIKPKKRAAVQKWYLVKQGKLSASSKGGSTTIALPYEAHINLVYSLVTHDETSDSSETMKALNKTTTVRFDKLYDSEKFTKYYENTSTELGCFYSNDKTTFRVWSPVSANMTVMLYDKDTSSEFAKEADKDTADKYDGYHMNYKSGGIWELTIEGDLNGKYYNYQVDNTIGTNIVMDPYATSAGANGIRGLIYDKASTNPEGWDSLPLKWDGVSGYDIESPQDLTIYEVHVQDFTGDESWKGKEIKGTYNAFVESGVDVEGTSISAGYDHLNELGVNAVQLMPVFDHDNDESDRDKGELKYNWGYNPLNYNVVEGGYSSDPHDGLARVKEFKNLVLQMSKTDVHTRVIMDVVYNHVSSATGSNFHKLMPRYYFRYAGKDYYNGSTKYQSAGELWDGSGCHNEVATERAMMRKFIVDSVTMWAKEYKIKGFRFDLMGLIDFKTLVQVKKALYEIDPDIYIYGEGWSLGYHGEGSDQWKEEHPGVADPGNFGGETWQIYNECNNYKTDGVYLGGFNDSFRDAMRGSNGSQNEYGKTYPGSGFIQDGIWREANNRWYADEDLLKRIGKGAWGWNTNVDTKGVYYPEQTVNYVSCHDNWTLRDQLYQTLPQASVGKHASAERILNASLSAHAMVMSANTPAFILGGEEILRTKEFTCSEDEIPSYVTPDSWTELYGKKISHNSYNSPLSVNSYKWNNKISINIDGETLTNEKYQYNEAFKSLIALHSKTIKKPGTQETDEQFLGSTYINASTSGKLNHGLFFSMDSGYAQAVGFQINETFIYIAGGDISYSDKLICEVNDSMKQFNYGGYSISGGYLSFSSQNASAVFTRNSK